MPDDEHFERARRLTAHLPGVEVASSYGKPALKVMGKRAAPMAGRRKGWPIMTR
ncbi:MAG TPA: hypothetical protein VJR87_03895 [Allosphingosinicella sp.]|nr:hypothetical protein [Allosphingosinicella sp.]